LARKALTLANVDAFYGDSHVLHRVSFGLDEGQLLGLLGRNGAGKSTCMNVTVGLLPPRAGAVEVFGEPVANRAPEAIAARGVALVPQGRRVFRSLTVRENLIVAARKPVGGGKALWTLDSVSAMFPHLGERRNQMAGLLSGGEQQMLAVARALARQPRLLLLDELSLGLAPVVVERLLPRVREYAQESGCAVLLVEQHVHLALEVADRGYVLSHGQIVLHRPVEELRADRQLLIASYLGEQPVAAAAGDGG
jgi:branched-chain amino acid transport system ATP-binding protein